MPQASPELRAKFPGSDAEAMAVLEKNFMQSKGIFRKKEPNYQPTQREWDAIDYMFQEWDYGYDAE